MSLMNYLGAVASAAVEAASASSVKGPVVASATGASTSNVNISEGSTIVSTTASVGNPDSSSRTIPQGLPSFPVVPITIHHSSGPSGQFTYALQTVSNGGVRLGSPHGSSVGPGLRPTFTMHSLAGQIPHFSFASGGSSQSSVGFRMQSPSSSTLSQVPAPVGSHVIDKQRNLFQVPFRGSSIPPSISQPTRPVEQEIRRESPPEHFRQKPQVPNLNTSRPSVLMGPRNNVPNVPHDFFPRNPALALSIVLQDHNYTLPKPSPTLTPASNFHVPQEVPTPAVPVSHRPPSPSSKNHPPAVQINPKPLPLYGNVRGSSPPVVCKSVRPRSTSPLSVPGRRRRKTFEKKEKEGEDFSRKVGVPGRKRTRRQIDSPVSNNTIPPLANDVPDSDSNTNTSMVKTNSSIPFIESEPTTRRLKKHRDEVPQQSRKNKEKVVEPEKIVELDEEVEETNSKDKDDSYPVVEEHEKEKEELSSSTLNTSSQEDSNNEGITRCICDYLHDDGFMICCDKCLMWQHVDCMGIDRTDIPENYLCELCKPRWVSKTRARAIQTRKKEMLELGVLDDTPVSRVAESAQDTFLERSPISRSSSLELTGSTHTHTLSPTKSSGKLKRRGRPSLSNGQPFSDSDSEIHSGLHSPVAKRSRKYSGKRGQNLNVLDDSPSKMGTRKQRSLEPRVKRGYTRRNTLSSPLSSPSSEDIKSVEDHKEDSTSCPDISDLLVQYNSVAERAGSDSDDRVSSINAPSEDTSRNEEIYSKGGSSDANGTFANIESRRKRKQIFKDIPNGDLSPPHIISSTSPPAASDKQAALKPRSPSFDKTISNTNSLSSSPEPPSSAVSSLHVNVSGFNSSSLCLYSSSPYLDKYEEAVNSVCSYSPELRAKLLKNYGMMEKSSVPEPEFTPLSENVKKWKLGVTSLEGGKKLRTLLAAVRVEPGEAIIEYIGKFLMLTGFQPVNKRTQGNPNMISPEPFVFFHQVPKNGMCICIDCRKYGNDARFVRRSCTPNAEIRHVVGKGTIHAYVVATAVIDLDEEVTIPHEYKSVTCNTVNSIVQKYHVMSPPLPCACSDLDTCKAVTIESVVGDVVHKKNGALISPTALPNENKERRRRMSSRRTSSLDKEAVESLRTPLASPSPQQQQQTAIVSPSDCNKSLISSSSPVEEVEDSPSVVPISKERVDGRTTRARTIAVAVSAEEASTPVSKRKVENTPLPPRQRNRSGADATYNTPTSTGEMHTSESHKMTREERKLQSVLKIIEKLESNQKKKESRQNQKKDKGGKSKKIEDRETDHDDELPLQVTPTSAVLAPIKFAPTIKKKGRKRGRSTSKSGGKPQLISHRNSGSIADLRSTSTESDINSADEASRAGMSPLQENMGPNFRLPKKKEMMSEWRIGGGHPSPSLPSQYMRKSNTAIVNHPGVSSAAVLPSTSSALSTPSNNFLSVPPPNGPLDNASAKKRWLRQAISEETDPAAAPVPSSNSRPDSPTGVECLAPLKKRRLARASMSSEVSNTPPSTPNNVDAAYCELDADGENEPEQNNDVTETEEPEVEATVREVAARKWSCSEVSSAEEDMEDLEDTKNDETGVSNAEVESKEIEDPMTPEPVKKSDSENDTSDSLNRSPRCSAGRRSRWDQVDAPEPVVNNSISSPVKSADAIVLDYVRNPEQYAKLTGVAAFDSEKGPCTYEKDNVQAGLNTTESIQAEVTKTTVLVPEPKLVPKTGRSALLNPKVSSRNDDDDNQYLKDADVIQLTHRIACEHAKSSPRTQTQVKKKLSMEEYLKRKMEGKSTDDRATALNQPSTALNAMVNSDSNSSEAFVLNVKDLSSPKPDDDPKIRGTLQFSSTPTLAERKREELGKRLYSFGIRVPDAESANVESIPAEKQPAQSVSLTTPTYTASPREVVSVEKPKSNGDITISYGRTGSTPSLTPANIPTSVGHRLSVPTPAALKQSGMPPLPSHLSSSPMHSNSVTVSTPNGASKPVMNSTPNGYASNAGMPQCGASYRHYRGSSSNGPSNYNHHQQNRNMLTSGPSNSSAVNSSTSGPIIGGVPVGNLIPPPPPPTSQGTAGPAFGNRFNMKKFFHSS